MQRYFSSIVGIALAILTASCAYVQSQKNEIELQNETSTTDSSNAPITVTEPSIERPFQYRIERPQSFVTISKAVNQTLDSYRAQHEKVSGKTLKVVYFCPKGTQPHAGYQARLETWLNDFEDFMGKEMAYHGFEGHGLGVDRDSEGKLNVYIVEGIHPADSYTYKWPTGHNMWIECKNALQTQMKLEQECILLLNNKPFLRADSVVRIDAPFYGAYQHPWGCGWAIDYPEITIENLSNTQEKITYSEHDWTFKRPKGMFATTYIGGAIHELGHAWGLPHNKLSHLEAARGESLMGHGNYFYRADRRHQKQTTVLSFPDAVRLASHPLFSHTALDWIAPLKIDPPHCVVFHKDSDILVQGKITSNIPAYAAIIYVDPLPAAINKDYDATAFVATLNHQGEFQFEIEARYLTKPTEIRVVICFANGQFREIRKIETPLKSMKDPQ